MFLISKEAFLREVIQRPRHFLFCGFAIFNEVATLISKKSLDNESTRKRRTLLSHPGHPHSAPAKVPSFKATQMVPGSFRSSWKLGSKRDGWYLARNPYYLKELSRQGKRNDLE